MMNLRHKKPINSYKGQTNNDRSEFNDDDFKQQGSPNKKNTTSSTEQIYKYAKILSKFTKIINEDYRNFDPSNADLRQQDLHSKRFEKNMMEQQNQLSLSYGKTEQNKYIKQIAKLQQRLQIKSSNKLNKAARRPKEELPNPSVSKISQNKTLESTQIPTDKKKPNDLRETQVSGSSIDKYKKDSANTNFARNQPNMNPPKDKSQMLPKTDGNNPSQASMNYMNSGLLNYYNISGMPGMLPSNVYNNGIPFFGVNQMNINQLLAQYSGQNNMSSMIRDPSMALNLGVMAANGLGLSANQLFPKPIQNLFTQQVIKYKTNIQPNGQVTQQSDKSYAKKVYPLTRNAYHVTIAYKIYLDKLKKDGVNLQNLQQIDPTRNARRIKNSQAAKSNGKQAIKKKK